MNQILLTKNVVHTSNKKNIYKFIFIFCVIIIFFIICISFKFFLSSQNDKISYSSFTDTVKIQYLYNNNIFENSTYPIIGRIEIEKINVNYPIFSTTTDSLLKLGVCKVYGPSINSSGNLCLAGHNYENHQFFSDLHFLKLKDNINIFDLNNNFVTYSIYSIFEVENNDTSILEQTNIKRELTLITCNNKNKKRLVIKAKEIE